MTSMKNPVAVSRLARAAGEPAGGCEIGALFSILAKPHMLHVIREFLAEPPTGVRFCELQNRLGLSPKTLSTRLKTLVEAGLLVRRQFNEIPPRVEYEATDKGRKLIGLFQAMEVWATENSLHTVGTVSVVGRA
jgi:DNA-binding HxlR family transcriptional regulator